ncbi:flagellar hook-associated protein FlgK [Desulfonatronospira thiodismutans ASO3-1]|uniref:Flagellar hook-associated protein 1 n=1 Tax=Desulfonatronospira thiodismutans ASO3-1 TaxID=555779 RepID=D6SR82_9BACT|nr:flagellar hook-associated protein FlgK [Desulfonatronospira thiodismutans]EFI33198.1 flagellar hook-associated protein FlgK [Desulfonatronospira thiodismutans ASO3-1]
MSGIHALMNSGRTALFANQSAIQTTGNNIANVNTEGYRRREVRLEEAMALDTAPGQIGTGVNAKEVFRHFDSFIETQYNDKSSDREMWQTMHEQLSSLEALFNESREGRMNEALADFWKDWQELSKRPDDNNVRTALLGNTGNLTQAFRSMDQDLTKNREQMDEFISQDVDRVNDILEEIAEINKLINVREVPGKVNLNELRDKRDLLVRELAEKVDINYMDKGGGDVTIQTKAGHTLVEGSETYRLKFEDSKTFSDLKSDFDGQIKYNGDSGYEFTIQVTEDGEIGGDAKFKVSLDGGKNWLTDDQGNTREFSAEDYDNRVTLPVDDMEIWFDDYSNNALAEGDEFTIVPKSGLYWESNTSSDMNITPQVMGDGNLNERRLTGGSLAGYFNFRDHYAGKYSEKLDALAESLAWEVNRIHSNGAGLEHMKYAEGTYQVNNLEAALGTPNAGLPHGEKLQNGNFTVHFYDEDGEVESMSPKFPTQDEMGNDPEDWTGNFDPDKHGLDHVMRAINELDNISAEPVNNRLTISADDDYEFSFSDDSTGLLAGLGINTFFQGHDASSLAVNEKVRDNIAHINAGSVNGAGEANVGDNTTAKNIAELQDRKVDITTSFEGTTSQTIQEYYNSLSGNVGSDTSMTKFNADYNKSLTDDLDRRQQEKSGVNLDEEMSNLIKYQHSYQAAARMISTADQMMQTLLGLKM